GEQTVRVTLRFRLLGSIHRHIAVDRKTRTRRNELSDDDVLLEAQERVRPALHRGLGEHTRGLLERSSRQPRLGRKARLRDTHDLFTSRRRALALNESGTVQVVVARAVNK